MSAPENFDFTLERISTLIPDSDNVDYLLEISWLYDRIVRGGSNEPVIDLAFELVLPLNFVGECVSNAMECGLLSAPKRGSNGGLISNKSLKLLKQVGKHRS